MIWLGRALLRRSRAIVHSVKIENKSNSWVALTACENECVSKQAKNVSQCFLVKIIRIHDQRSVVSCEMYFFIMASPPAGMKSIFSVRTFTA